MMISGIITTNLGKTATFARGAGRERRVHHSKSLPLPLTRERLFFVCRIYVFVVSRELKWLINGLSVRFCANFSIESPWLPQHDSSGYLPFFIQQSLETSSLGSV
jgi:hypothetical protein